MSNNYYYTEEQEQAVIDFINSDDNTERNYIYNKFLRKPISKMISALIRGEGLYPENMDFKTIHDDVLTHLILKFNKYNPETQYKSFSYYSVIVKNYLIAKVREGYNKKKTDVKYLDIAKSLEERPDMIYDIETVEVDYNHFFGELIESLEEQIKVFKEKRNKLLERESKTTKYKNEINVGYAIIQVLSDWENIFADYEGEDDNKKFKKNIILLYLRNLTGLSTKEIRNSTKKYKSVYNLMKTDYFDE